MRIASRMRPEGRGWALRTRFVLGSGPYQLVVMGDSKTARGFNTGGWVLQLEPALESDTGQAWTTTSYYVSGSRLIASVDDHLAEIIAQVPDTSGLETICVANWGVNDMLDSPAQATWIARYQTLIDAIVAKQPAAKVFIAKPWMVDYDTWANTMSGWIDTIVASRPGEAFVGHDERDWLKGADNGATMTSDGVHYSTAGQTECSAQLFAIITG